jgi:hypothetical protein
MEKHELENHELEMEIEEVEEVIAPLPPDGSCEIW